MFYSHNQVLLPSWSFTFCMITSKYDSPKKWGTRDFYPLQYHPGLASSSTFLLPHGFTLLILILWGKLLRTVGGIYLPCGDWVPPLWEKWTEHFVSGRLSIPPFIYMEPHVFMAWQTVCNQRKNLTNENNLVKTLLTNDLCSSLQRWS